MLKIGVLGAGHLGKIHLNCIKQIEQYNLVGFYDPDGVTAQQVEEELQVKSFDSIDDLVEAVDVVDIVTPTIRHFECASKALQKRRHVFIEKPIVATPDEANALKQLADEAGVKVQVGHVERFNPAFIAAEPFITEPLFVEAHRLALFNPRGTDVPVVLDLMIHDLDILLTIVHALEEGSGGALHGLKCIAEHRVAAVGILGYDGRSKQSDACCSGRYKLNAET